MNKLSVNGVEAKTIEAVNLFRKVVNIFIYLR
jgi:hypothetical protein